MNNTCIFCHLSNQKITKHHLIPKTEHNHKNKKLFNNSQLNETVDCCLVCHNKIHSMFTEKTLAEQFNTVEKLLSNREFQTFIQWRIKHPNILFSPSKQQNKRN